VVAGVDGSPGARKALAWAVDEARLRRCSLRVVHAWMVPLIDAMPEPLGDRLPADRPSDDEVYEHLVAVAKGVLDEALDEAKGWAPELEIEGELVEARAAGALIAAAGDAELLVVGSRGRGGFGGLLLGSVSAQCVHNASCPVVVVPPDSGEG
jgi:nucleotide-binding universal stress UspA family protein